MNHTLEYFTDPTQIKLKTEKSIAVSNVNTFISLNYIKDFESEQNEIAKLKSEITWENTFERLDNVSDIQFLKFNEVLQGEGIFMRWLWTCELMAKVMPNADARKEYNNSIATLKQFSNKTWMVIL